MICYLFPQPIYFFFTSGVPVLLYYAHIPSIVISLFLGFYIFWSNRKALLNQLFFGISILFSLWTLINLITWTNINSQLILFVWSFFSLILALIAILSIYFIYVFLKKKDVSNRIKIIFLALLAPVFLLMPTSFNLGGFNLTDCDAFKFENLPFKIYYTLLGLIAIVWIFVLLIRHYRVAEPDFRRQIVLLGIGIELFLFLFFVFIFIASYLTQISFLTDSQLEMYGLLGMPVFIIYLSILMVRFKTFNVKLIATQALVWCLAILIGSQFFSINNTTDFILTAVTFTMIIVFGILLVKSVKKEIEQKEQLAVLLKQRESLTHLITHKVKGSFTRSKYIFAEILEGSFGAISEELKDMATKGLNSDNEGIETVDLVLNAANLQVGSVKYEMKEINFKEIVSQVIEEKKPSAVLKNLNFEINIKEGNYNLLGDKFWLKEAVRNLVENSIRYTPSGSITVGLENKIGKVLFSVKDTGVGITDEDKNNLFTEGGRGKNSVSLNVDSTGYGLYTVKLIIEAHKGRVWADSIVGKGSTFFIELNTI